jgi:uncharacterized protein (DUF58 family)
MIRLTKAGQLFLGVIVALYLASLTSNSGLLLFLIGIIGGCFVLNLVTAFRVVREVQIFPPENVTATEGERLTQPWKVVNRCAGRTAGLIEVKSTAGTLMRVPTLPAGGSISVVPELVPQRRGVFPHGEVRVASVFPFGLVEIGRRLRISGETVVHPALYEAPVPPTAGFDVVVGGKHSGARRATSGSSFAGVRPLQPGDPVRQIHWKSSSKGRGLMVKTFDEELSGRVAFIVDAGASGDARVLDDCLRAAGSLMFAALDAGHHVEWVDLGTQEQQLVPPFADGHELLDALARVGMNRDCLTEEKLGRAVERVSRKAAVCLVLTQVTAPVAATVGHLLAQHRKLAVYLPAKLPVSEATAGWPVMRYEERCVVVS